MTKILTEVLIIRGKKRAALETVELIVSLGKMQFDYLFHTANNWELAFTCYSESTDKLLL